MKKLHELTLGAAMTLFALTACNNEAILPDAPQVNESDNPNACVLLGDDFRWEGNESRTALTIEDNVAKFSWTPGDLVGILPDKGAQVYFTIPEPEEEVTDENRRKASFDGGAWALRAESNYAAYYPFVKDFHLDRTKVPVNYTGQQQKGITTAHLGKYDYQGARPVTTNANGGGVTFDFDHVGALVLLKFTVPEAETKLNSVTLSAEGVTFITEGTYDLTSTEGFPITATETSATMTVGIEEYTTTTANEEVTVYFMCAPVDLSDKLVNVSVAYGEGGATLELAAEGKNLEAAGGYVLTVTPMGDITDPAQTKKGDFAMKDGSFISYSEGVTLTDEQKANVAGIVFWTESEDDGPSTLVGDAVADQVMQSAFPNCTHGLIVSLTDVSTKGSCSWQSSYESIYDKFQNTGLFNPGNKANYVAIESGYNETDNINKILGYNNTKVLEAYNAHCKANDKSGYLVQPIEALAEWKKSNSDIANTTGWFLPSGKELHMLCYKDVADVYDEGGKDKLETWTVVNSSLGKVGGTQFGDNYYWSSSEGADGEDIAFYVHLNKAYVSCHFKVITLDVRAVCAY